MRFPILTSCQIHLTKSAFTPSLSRFVTGADGGEICTVGTVEKLRKPTLVAR